MVKKIMWDPGHGGSDPGAVGNGLQEEHLTLKVVNYAVAYINANYTDFEQRITRSHEQTFPLNNRDDVADSWGADAFVSVHINAGGGTGFESYIYTNPSPAESALQNILHEEVLAAMKQFGSIKNRGKKRANFAVLRETNMPSILTENLFIDSNDSNHLKNEEFIKAVGEAHARGVAKHLGLKKKPAKIISFYTGGYVGESLGKVQSFISANKWWYKPERNQDGSISFTIGGFTEGGEPAQKLEKFLKDNKWWYRIQ
jgi:N-acetylmuramoyl-L-alanine amidase